MLCIPCFIIPVVLFFWRWLIQPYFLKYIWNPWHKKDKDGKVIEHTPDFIKSCEGGKCIFVKKPAVTATGEGGGDQTISSQAEIMEGETNKKDD